MGFAPGEIVGEYRIIESVGSGGMGEVFRVEHTITRRIEAMKVLASGHSAQEHAQRFLREIQIQARLSHPNIASVYNAFWVEDDLVMVMELVEGKTLESLMAVGAIPLEKALDCASQALTALRYAHAHGVTHRDITPANLILTPEGIIKVTDFGLAKSPTNPRLTRSGSVMGSPYYMSPEQVRGVAEVDARTDIYSLGAVLYEMVTGQKVFDSDNAFAMMQAHVECPPKAPSGIVANLPAELDDVILIALAKEPGKRFQSAQEFGRALIRIRQKLAEGSRRAPEKPKEVEPAPLPEPPQPATPAPPPRAPSQAMRYGAVTAAVFAGLSAGVLFWQSLDRRPVESAPPQVTAPADPSAEVAPSVPEQKEPQAAARKRIRKAAPRARRVPAAALEPRITNSPAAAITPAPVRAPAPEPVATLPMPRGEPEVPAVEAPVVAPPPPAPTEAGPAKEKKRNLFRRAINKLLRR